MAKKKLTPRQRQLAELSKNYQASLQALGPEYQSTFEQKQKLLSEYNTQLESYQAKLSDYNTRLSESNKSKLKFVDGLDEYPNRSWKQGISYYVEGVGRVLPATLEQKGYQVFGNEQVGLTEIRAKPIPQPLTEKQPVSPDLSKYDAELAKVEEKKQAAQQTFERETTERRSARLRAVTQGSRERPMLSRGVKLNG